MRSLALLLTSIAVGNVVLHDGLVRHERCAEHGDLVDVHHAVAEHDDIDLAGLHEVPTTGAHDDDHCPLATHPSRADTPTVLLVVDLERGPANEACARAGEQAPRARAAWRTPPATGPPALAA